MKVLSVLGSPRIDGNTAKLLKIFEDALSSEHCIEHIDLQGLNIAGCRECMTCRKCDPGNYCAIQDDMTPLFESVLACDVFVLATPVFTWSYTAQAKAFMDRLYALDAGTGSKLAGKKTALIISAGGDAFDGADLIVAGFAKYADYNDMHHAGQVVSAPMAEGVVEPHTEAALKALANSICAS